MEQNDQLISTLEAIDFGSLLGAPLTACVEAQAQAADATTQYIQKVGFNHTDGQNYDAKTIQFSFTLEGQRKRITVPLISIVPLPYLQIDNVNIDFTADVALSDGYLVGRVATENRAAKEKLTQTESSTLKKDLQIKVAIKASTSDMPFGISRILEVLSNSVQLEEKQLPATPSDNEADGTEATLGEGSQSGSDSGTTTGKKDNQGSKSNNTKNNK